MVAYCLNFWLAQNLTGIKGLSEAKVDKICEAAEKIVVSLNVSNCCYISVTSCICFILIVKTFLLQNFGYMTGSDALLKVRLIDFNKVLKSVLHLSPVAWSH